jgi:flagellin
MRINHNIAALNTYNKLNSASGAQSKSMEKLSSGLRINRAGDDAAGLAISEKMRGQIRGLDMASKNSQDAISLVQTAEGALNETHDILQRMRELSVQASNDTNTTSDREEIQKELNQMTSEINRIGNTTEFNTQKLLNGEKATTAVATSGMVSGTAAAAATITTGGVLALKIDGTDVNVTLTTADTYAQAVTKINAAANTALGTTGQTYAADNSGTLDLTSLTTGSGSSVEVVSGAGTTLADLKLTAGAKDAGDNAKAPLSFQIGANENQSLTLSISDMRAQALLISTANNTDSKLAVTNGTDSTASETALSVLTHSDAAATVTKIQEAIDKVSAERSKLGANQNRLEHTINNLSTSSENLTAAESRIRDVDYALAA